MSKYQVGDKVRLEGVVTYASGQPWLIEVEGTSGGKSDVCAADVTLVERPRKKLRVGSVWQVIGSPKERYVVSGYSQALGGEIFIGLHNCDEYSRSELTIDQQPGCWREVPVEELEREAK